jgi:DNA mismatch repair protein MSH2
MQKRFVSGFCPKDFFLTHAEQIHQSTPSTGDRHRLVATFADDSSLRQTLQTDFLRFMPDLLRNSKRFQKGVASLEDVVNVYQGVIRLPALIAHLEEAAETGGDLQTQKLIRDTFVKPLTESQHLLAKLVEMVETTIDLEELERHHYVIKPEYDDRLGKIKASINRALDQLEVEHSKVKKDLNMPADKVKLEDTQQYGYCFRVTRNDSKVLLTKKKQYIELGTSIQCPSKRSRQASDCHYCWLLPAFGKPQYCHCHS